MAFYTNHSKGAAISGMELTPVADGNFSFVHVKSAGKVEETKERLTRLGQEFIAETTVNGHPVLVTRGSLGQDDLLGALAENGDTLALPERTTKFNPWAWRGNMSMAGQTLQLISAFSAIAPKNSELKGSADIDDYKKKPVDIATLGFAVTNLTANTTNIMFGGEKAEDVHRLHFLKTEINKRLEPHRSEGVGLPMVDDHRAALRQGPEEPKTLGEKTHDFIKANSVRGGEIGLRFLGAFSMAYPLKGENWKNAAAHITDPVQAHKDIQNTKDAATLKVGYTYLIGKTIALFSKVPDPYSPEPHTWVDTMREKVLFRASSLIEAGAAAYLAYDRFKNRQVNIMGKVLPDVYGAVGGALFTGGLLIRFFAPFGSKEVDMEELYAHATDAIAAVPATKQPQVIADTAAFLKDHFKEKKLSFGEIYTRLTMDLYRDHHMAAIANDVREVALQDNLPAAERVERLYTDARMPTLQPGAA